MTETRPFYQDGLEVAALELRLVVILLQGVVGAGDLKVTQGAGSTVDVALGQAILNNNFASFQGRYGIVNDATKNSANFEGGGIPAPGAQPALHQIVAKMWDPAYEAVGVNGRRWRLMVVPGAPASGCTIDNRLGAVDAAVGAQLVTDPWRNALRLADVHQATNGVLTIRDRRPFARGQYRRILRTANAAAGSDYTTTSTSMTPIDATNLSTRIECSGFPMRVAFRGTVLNGLPDHIRIQMRMDGVQLEGREWAARGSGANHEYAAEPSWDCVPASGSHLFVPY